MAALDWAVAAMRETADRLFQASVLDRADGYALISEAVWQITIVDATLVRYRPDIYNSCLARQAAVQRRLTEALSPAPVRPEPDGLHAATPTSSGLWITIQAMPLDASLSGRGNRYPTHS